ncbi:hypothetical protein C9994_03960 [Marivirga lumbricoides]|uniref:Amidohydrolase-related domain-containing protein n=1 Tax=Marivirga lumbricoides TaxID=1046115 RepID=A0A2T4DTT3_9BACT|nr:hypothetical protein C9994_03960 [Marivirga lumbricoides]
MKNMKMTIVGIVIAIFSVQVSFAQRVLIKNVNVIDVERGEVQEGRDLSIENGVIQAISPTKKYRKKEENTTLIDGAGKYVIPGFIDTHVHTAMGPANVSFDGETPHLTLTPLEELPAITAKLLLQYGVTTARDPGGKTEITVQTKMDLLNDKMEGPELMVAGNIIDTTEFTNMVVKVSNEEEILSEIRKQKTAGVDFIKLYTSLSPQLLKSGIEESHKLGLQTIAHLHGTSWTEASNLGIDNIVHIVPGHERYLPEADRAAYQQASLMGSFSFYKWFEYVDLNSDEIAELIQTLKSNNTSIDPTLVVFHATFFW